MSRNYYSNICTLIDRLSEGILILDSESRIIANNKFMEIFDIKKEEVPNILQKLDGYCLDEVLSSSGNVDRNIYVKDRKIKVEKLVMKASEQYEYSMLIFKDREDIEDSISQINELKHSLDVMKDILDNAYQGMVLVDEDGRILKWNYEKLLGIKERDALGKPVEKVIENTRLHIVVKTGKKELCDIQRIQGHNMIASRIPVIKDGKTIGALGTVLFRDIEEVKTLAKKLEVLENTVGKYKGEISKMYRARYSFDDIITQNEKMLKLKEIARKAAELNSTIMIRGESGTGKEYFAHAIHNASLRKYEPFIRINCAAIPHELLESELFGYEGGAFTGAKKEGKLGKFELANGGTILLDEISSMPYSMQSKLLRVLEEREFERIGGNTRIKADVRIIASTNENLEGAVREGRFRQDLFYRLNVVEIDIPPLRNRLDDIRILSEYILNELVQKMGFPYKTIMDKANLVLRLYDWPGNVRELRNVLERAANISFGNTINPEHLPDYITNRFRGDDYNEKACLLKAKVAETEINAIMEALRLTNGNRTDAAKYLGIHRTALYKKMDNYGINVKSIPNTDRL